MEIKKYTMILMLIAASVPGYSQEIGSKEQPKREGKLVLDLQGIISGVLARNPDTRMAFIDYSGSDNDRKKFLGQYDVYAYGKAYSQYRQLAKDNPSISQNGYQVSQTGVEAGLQKSFLSGTTVQAGVSTLHQDITTPVTGVGMMKFKGYSSEVNVGLSQELLKNAFGSNDRLSEKSLQKSSEIKQRAAKQAVSESIMSTFVSYWNFIIANENLKTAQIAFRNTQDIRDLVRRKSSAGISEKEELFDWEGRVLQAKNGVDGAELSLLNSRLAILRALDLDRGTDLEIRQNLSTDEMKETVESAFAEAVRKRVDLQNMKACVQLSEMNLEIAKGNSLPSLKASAGMGYNDYDSESRSKSFDTYNKQWNVSVTMSKSLGGTYDEANIDDAKKNLSKSRIQLKQLEDGIRDEIQIRVGKCSAAYRIYRQTNQSAEYAKAYYDQVYRRFSQGRYESAQLKLAFDNYIMLKNSALKSLVDYNVAILELDIAKNSVFERYSIDIDGAISRYAEKQ
jgi:outer membrane protein TolC